MIYVTSDIHGYPLDKFQKLLSDAGFTDNDFLFVLGDVIDRNGDGGIEMLRWMMLQPNVELVCGNHEDMMLSCRFLFSEVTEENLAGLTGEGLEMMQSWSMNGSKPTIDALRSLHREDPELVQDIFDYIADAPMYETVSIGHRDFLLVHAGLGNFDPDKTMYDYTVKDVLWHRPEPYERYYDDIYTVLGHTPTEHYDCTGRAYRTDTWIDIDTGAAAGGAPMLLRLDDMKEFYAED